MAQYFSDIQVSDKGMIKLIRNNGKDYIFPASKIIQVQRVKPKDDPNSWVPIARDLFSLFGSDAFKETRPETICIVTSDDYLYVSVPYSDALYSRIDNAHTYSTNRAKDKYGTFRQLSYLK